MLQKFIYKSSIDSEECSNLAFLYFTSNTFSFKGSVLFISLLVDNENDIVIITGRLTGRISTIFQQIYLLEGMYNFAFFKFRLSVLKDHIVSEMIVFITLQININTLGNYFL